MRVCMHVKSGDYKPVLLQGLKELTIGESDTFEEDDFASCIQSRFQCDMLKKFVYALTLHTLQIIMISH